MRQVGDRLIPVGVTSGRIHPLAAAELPLIAPIGEEGGADPNPEGRTGRRQRWRQQRHAEQQQNRDLNQMLGTMGLGGQELEDVSSHLNASDTDPDLTILDDDHGSNAPFTH